MASKKFTNNGQGRLYVAPANTSVPEDFAEIVTAVTSSSGSFKQAGDIHKDGLTVTPRSVDVTLETWNGDESQDTHAEWKMKNIDFCDEEVIKMAFGADNVTSDTTGCVVDFSGDMPEEVVLVAVMKDGDKGVAQVLRNGRCTNLADYKFAKGDYTVHDMTLKEVKATSGKTAYMVVERDVDADNTEE